MQRKNALIPVRLLRPLACVPCAEPQAASVPKWPPVLWLLMLGFCLATALPLRAQSYSGMVSFGDSFSDGGNMNTAISILGEQTAQYVTGFDPNYYYNYRFSDGPIWTDRLYTSLGFGPLGSMGANDGAGHTNGTNFSWAASHSGTGTSSAIFPNLQLQIDSYSTQLANANPALPAPATTLFTIWSGANDVLASVENGDPVTPAQVADNIATAITSLYGEGGRFFLVPSLPPLGDTPLYIIDPVKRAAAAALVDSTNSLLNISLDSLTASLSDIKIIKLDINQLFLDVAADPGSYGFTNVTDTAYIRYGDEPYEPRDPPYGELAPHSDGYFYWDAIHETAAVNSLIGNAAYQAVTTAVPEPSAGAIVLVAGLALLVLGRNRRRALRQP